MQPPPAPMPQQPLMQPAMRPGVPTGYAPDPHFRPVHWQPVPAPVLIDGFAIVQPRLKPIPSGPAIGSLVAGIGGLIGGLPAPILAAVSPWTGLVLFMFAALFALGGITLAVIGRRQVRFGGGTVSGGGIALTGLVLGLVLAGFALLTGGIALAGAL